MTKEQAFFIDLVNAIPDNTHWSLQCYADEFYATLRGIPLMTEPAMNYQVSETYNKS